MWLLTPLIELFKTLPKVVLWQANDNSAIQKGITELIFNTLAQKAKTKGALRDNNVVMETTNGK